MELITMTSLSFCGRRPLSVVVLLHGVSVPSLAPDILGNPDGIPSQAAAAAAVGMINVLAV
jgi:hypothetical protein